MANILGHLQLWQRSVAYDSSPHFPVALHLSRSYPRTTNEIRGKLIMSSTKWFPRDPRRGDGEFDLWGWMLPSHIFTLLAPPSSFFFRLATGLRRIWFAPKQNIKKKTNKSNQKKKKKPFRLKSRLLYYCNGPPFPHAHASSPSLVRHALHKLCFPNRLPAASDSCQACSMLSSTDTRLAQPYLHACPASDRSFHYHGNDSTVFSPVTRFIYRGVGGGGRGRGQFSYWEQTNKKHSKIDTLITSYVLPVSCEKKFLRHGSFLCTFLLLLLLSQRHSEEATHD